MGSQDGKVKSKVTSAARLEGVSTSTEKTGQETHVDMVTVVKRVDRHGTADYRLVLCV